MMFLFGVDGIQDLHAVKLNIRPGERLSLSTPPQGKDEQAHADNDDAEVVHVMCRDWQENREAEQHTK